MKNIYCVVYKSLEKDELNSNKTIAEQTVLGKKIIDYLADLTKQLNCERVFYFDEPSDIPSDSYILLLDIYRPFLDPDDLKKLSDSEAELTMLADSGCATDTGIYFMKSKLYSGYAANLYFSRAEKLPAENSLFVQMRNKQLLMEAASKIKDKINSDLICNGIILIDPNSTYISPNVKIGRDTIIYPNTFIEGATEIGENCIIGMNSRILDSIIYDNVEIEQSVILNSQVGEGTSVGPFAYIRPNSSIGKHCKIGNFVDVKNSVIGDNTKAAHLTYIGDSDVGNNINFGCGTITCNYDGANKSRTVIKDNVFIGCNTNLIAPVEIQGDSYIAAGSTITNTVPEGSLAIARARQVLKTDWKRPVKNKKTE